MFWIAVAAALGTIGGVIVGVTVARDSQTPLTSDPWFLVGAGLVAMAVLAVGWAIVLNLAHGHAGGHADRHAEGEAGNKGPRRRSRDYASRWTPSSPGSIARTTQAPA